MSSRLLRKVSGSPIAAGKDPSQITSATVKLWLKADTGLFQDSAGTTPATADTDPIGRWEDQSGGGHHFTQTDGSRKPQLKLGTLGGQNAVRCDGANDFVIYEPASPFISSDDSEAWVVLHTTRVTPDFEACFGFASDIFAEADLVEFWTFDGAADKTVLYHSGPVSVATTATTSGALTSNVDHCVVWGSLGPNVNDNFIEIDGADQALTSDAGFFWGPPAGNITDPQYNVGSGRDRFGPRGYYTGDLAELFILDGNPDAADRAALETYLTSKYGIIFA